MAKDKDSKLQQIGASVAAITAAAPALLIGDEVSAAIALFGVGAASVMENIRARTRSLDDAVRDALADERLRERFDETVKTDEFLALYVRSRDTAAKSEKEQKLRYIRNFLINAVILPTSREPDKERYLRLIDELSFREHEHFVEFMRMVVPSAGSSSLEEWVTKPVTIGGMISTFACRILGVPDTTSSAEVNDMTAELVVAFRHLHAAGLLNGVPTRSPTGDMFQFSTNGFTAKFLRFVLDPF
ncbi:MAG TPA: hypothetical protein VEK57_08840 [Thermoanaerobaculia bacterium]|nr:hypothetical protein [Thermoanaerobaculia bacterium]